VVAVAYLWFKAHPSSDTTVPQSKETVLADEFGFSFSYPVGDNGLTLIEPPIEGNPFKKAYILMPDQDYEAFKLITGGTETPASVSVFVYEFEDDETATGTDAIEKPNRITRLQNWAKDNAQVTSFNLAKGTPDIIEIDSVKALHYKADGLYQQDIYLASYRGFIYMFTAQYNAETDITFQAFQEIIASVSFD
jgi:hypothetical protein